MNKAPVAAPLQAQAPALAKPVATTSPFARESDERSSSDWPEAGARARMGGAGGGSDAQPSGDPGAGRGSVSNPRVFSLASVRVEPRTTLETPSGQVPRTHRTDHAAETRTPSWPRIRLQAKMRVSRSDDAYEREADRMADAVMRMPEPRGPWMAPAISRTPEPRKPGTETLQARSVSAQTSEVTPDVESRIHASRGRGRVLSPAQRDFFEPRFGRDFGDVRVHTDSDADQLARSVDAQAFTVGRDVYFRAGAYAPDSQHGKRLLAHELTHTIQQGGGLARRGIHPRRPRDAVARLHLAATDPV